MYMFDLNRHYNQRYNQPIVALIHIELIRSHTNGRSMKNTMAVVINCLVGTGL